MEYSGSLQPHNGLNLLAAKFSHVLPYAKASPQWKKDKELKWFCLRHSILLFSCLTLYLLLFILLFKMLARYVPKPHQWVRNRSWARGDVATTVKKTFSCFQPSKSQSSDVTNKRKFQRRGVKSLFNRRKKKKKAKHFLSRHTWGKHNISVKCCTASGVQGHSSRWVTLLGWPASPTMRNSLWEQTDHLASHRTLHAFLTCKAL